MRRLPAAISIFTVLFFVLSFGGFAFAQGNGNNQPGTSIPQQIQDLQDQIDTIELTPGPQGETGPQGPTGNDGADGADGAQGPQGPAGADGADGAQGPQGPAGADGADGAQGPQGPAGDPASQLDSADGVEIRQIVQLPTITESCMEGSIPGSEICGPITTESCTTNSLGIEVCEQIPLTYESCSETTPGIIVCEQIPETFEDYLINGSALSVDGITAPDATHVDTLLNTHPNQAPNGGNVVVVDPNTLNVRVPSSIITSGQVNSRFKLDNSLGSSEFEVTVVAEPESVFLKGNMYEKFDSRNGTSGTSAFIQCDDENDIMINTGFSLGGNEARVTSQNVFNNVAFPFGTFTSGYSIGVRCSSGSFCSVFARITCLRVP